MEIPGIGQSGGPDVVARLFVDRDGTLIRIKESVVDGSVVGIKRGGDLNEVSDHIRETQRLARMIEPADDGSTFRHGHANSVPNLDLIRSQLGMPERPPVIRDTDPNNP